MNLILRAIPFLLVAPTAFAAVAISVQSLVDLVIGLIIVGLVLGLLIFLVRKAPFIPDPWKSGIEYLIYFVAVIIVINLLLGLAGYPLITLR